MADGQLKIEYISFTDNSTFYDPDVVSGSADATNRLYFEQCHLPQDQITFEADDSGKLKPFKISQNNGKYQLSLSTPGKIIEALLLTTGSLTGSNYFFLTGSGFASIAEGLLSSSIKNFNNLQLIATKDYIFEDDGFSIGPSDISFDVYENGPLPKDYVTRNLEDLESLFYDSDFSNVINFKYLPPINKTDDKFVNKSDESFMNQNKIGNYVNLKQDSEIYTPKKLEDELSAYELQGYMRSVSFDPTSLNNRIFSQFFEITSLDMKKLDVLDYGIYRYNDKLKQAFFVGKVFVDGNGAQTFVKMFTLVFE